MGNRIAQKIREFGAGLNTVHNAFSLLQLVAISLLMWYVSPWHITRSRLPTITPSRGWPKSVRYPGAADLLLMGSSMVGSILQLPGVGGGSQLATIATLEHIFDVPKELAPAAALCCGW